MAKANQKAVLEAIEGSGGVVSTIARRLDVSWYTADRYVKKWTKTREAFEAELEKIKDMAESAIMRSIKEGNTQDAKWFLARKAKDRGYADKLEVEGKNETVITVFEIPDNGRLTEEVKKDGKS